MDGFATVIIFLIFLAVTFSRKSKQVKTQPPNKPIIPIQKKDPWAPDSFVTSPPLPKPIVQDKIAEVANMNRDRIALSESFWSNYETNSYFHDQSFSSMENKDLMNESLDKQTIGVSDKRISKQIIEKAAIFPELSPNTLVQAVVMNVILEKPSERHCRKAI